MPVIRVASYLGVGLWAVLGCAGTVRAYDDSQYEQPPILYSQSKPTDPVAQLQERLEQGKLEWPGSAVPGFLPALLTQLDIPVSSQALVFSKTSVQKNKISPATPRAIYFNDDVYVGVVQHSNIIEIASMDPNLGAIFYTLNHEPHEKARLTRQTNNCLQCHDNSVQCFGLPGLLVRSLYTDDDGEPRFNLGGFRTTDRSPFNERWGGWYVSGTHGSMRHLGNVTYTDNPDLKPLVEQGANKTSLKDLADLSSYLTDTSDIVALMVLEHQAYTHNVITRANFETRRALLQNEEIQKLNGKPVEELTQGLRSRIRANCEPVVEALLFSEEAVLSAPVRGVSNFQKEFEQRGPFDEKQRSLRQFDLNRRMFKYPCSYLIYSKSFRALPPMALDYIYGRLWEILSGRDASKPFAHLSEDDRANIAQILRATMPELAAKWK